MSKSPETSISHSGKQAIVAFELISFVKIMLIIFVTVMSRVYSFLKGCIFKFLSLLGMTMPMSFSNLENGNISSRHMTSISLASK